jgi:hypothetical protein
MLVIVLSCSRQAAAPVELTRGISVSFSRTLCATWINCFQVVPSIGMPFFLAVGAVQPLRLARRQHFGDSGLRPDHAS